MNLIVQKKYAKDLKIYLKKNRSLNLVRTLNVLILIKSCILPTVLLFPITNFVKDKKMWQMRISYTTPIVRLLALDKKTRKTQKK